jgi:hypothetical protein
VVRERPFRSTVPGPWLVRAVGALLNVTAIATLSALGAAAVWTPVSGSVPLARRLVLGLLASGLTTTSLFYLSHWLERTPGVMAVMLPFYVVMFAMPIAVTSLPMLLIAHVWIRTHVGLALVGAVISPLAMLVMLYVDTGGAKEVIKCLRDAPAMCAVMTVPFTMGSGVLAWILPARRAARAAK